MNWGRSLSDLDGGIEALRLKGELHLAKMIIVIAVRTEAATR